MYDQVAAVALVAPGLIKTVEQYVDVDANPGLNYGVSVGAAQTWPGGEGARKMQVQTDLDWDKFIRLVRRAGDRLAGTEALAMRARSAAGRAPEGRHDRC